MFVLLQYVWGWDQQLKCLEELLSNSRSLDGFVNLKLIGMQIPLQIDSKKDTFFKSILNCWCSDAFIMF